MGKLLTKDLSHGKWENCLQIMSKSEPEIKLAYSILFYSILLYLFYSILLLCVHQSMCEEECVTRETREKRRIRKPRTRISPGWCGSADWVPACEPKGGWFDSQSGHMPGLQARSLVGGRLRGNPSMYLSHIDVSPPPPSLPVSLKTKTKTKQ